MTEAQIARDQALAAVIQAAMLGGSVARRYFENLPAVQIKPDGTPVTEADKETEFTIVELLQKKFPEYGFLGEETGERGPEDRRWIIDPIDGTRNFIRGIPNWAVLIALEENGTVTLGVIYKPVTRELWFAKRDCGAYYAVDPISGMILTGPEPWEEHYPRHRILVSKTQDLAKSMLLHSDLKHIKAQGTLWKNFLNLLDATERSRGPGDFLGCAMVAQGQAEIYLDTGGLHPWDLAAPSIIVREAGGRFTDFSGRETIHSGEALATNGKIHEQVLAILKERS